jgi:hypothetical protein
MYDFLLGGHDNFAVDRAAALALSETAPEVRLMAMVNRKFPRHLHAGKRGVKEDDAGRGKATYGSICLASQ